MNIRAAAARVIAQVVEQGKSLSDSLPSEVSRFTDSRDRALLQAICFGVCRWYFPLQTIVEQLLDKPMKQKDFDLHALLLVGLYQLIEMRLPPYAAVSETVAATKELKKIWAKNLVNGVLREYQRRAEEFDEIDLASHPRWIIESLQKTYPTAWENILDANNQHPPFSLRVNQQHQSREAYLAQHDLVALPIAHTQAGIVLEEAIDVQKLPGFLKGDISVQDGAAQLAAELLQLEKGQRVLDACAAPGGKTAHILEMAPDLLECVAIDKDATRLAQVADNLQRLNLSATLLAKDAGDIKSWWDGQLFDRVLLDAPCSATGVIRRHPDIKLLRRPSDIHQFAKEQLRLLTTLWEVLKPGGLMVYATCSFLPEENAQVVQAFLSQQSDAKEEKISAAFGMACEVGRQILPGQDGMDGFYYACLRK
jgi:16S rRNA (cytosine967-C5)-methyltransferase